MFEGAYRLLPEEATLKILVIDDDQGTRIVLREILRSEGYDVSLAEDGERGLQLARAERPSLVITDILMPRVDGFRFLSEVRKDPDLRDLPVVFYTGNYLDREDEKLAGDLGVTKYLIKPVAPGDLLSTVKELLAGTGAPAALPSRHTSLDEPVVLKLYNERLVAKLKHHVVEKEDARQSLERIVEGIADGVLVIDRHYKIIQANSAAASTLGFDRSEMINRTCYEITHKRQTPCEGPNIVCPHALIIGRGEEAVKVLHTHYDARGDERHFEITASPIRDDKGIVFAMVETYRDIMEKRSDDELVKLIKRLNEAQTHLKHMAITDDLTGLRNRRYITERLEEEFQRAKRSGGLRLSLIMLDIDHFKQINDVHGHLFGDVVLRVISSRVKSSLRKHDIVGRVGGEEFLVICPGSTLEETVIVAERIRKVINIEAIGDGIKEVTVALSAGVTSLHEEDTTSDRLFSRADTALYRAKEEGRNRVVVM